VATPVTRSGRAVPADRPHAHSRLAAQLRVAPGPRRVWGLSELVLNCVHSPYRL